MASQGQVSNRRHIQGPTVGKVATQGQVGIQIRQRQVGLQVGQRQVWWQASVQVWWRSRQEATRPGKRRREVGLVGGRLLQFQEAWREMTDSTWVNNIIQSGYSIIFDRPPPLRLPPLHDPFNSPEERTDIDTEVRSLLQKRAIEGCSGKGFYSRIFTIPKKTGDLRPVLNLRPLNQFLTAPKFKMETLANICRMLKPGDWLMSIDLSDAFLHVAVHPASCKYLRFG